MENGRKEELDYIYLEGKGIMKTQNEKETQILLLYGEKRAGLHHECLRKRPCLKCGCRSLAKDGGLCETVCRGWGDVCSWEVSLRPKFG